MDMISYAIVFSYVTFVFAFKHFVADFVFQNEYMLGKFKKFPYCILPLSAHCLVHAVFTGAFVVGILIGNGQFEDFYKIVALFTIYDFTTHFVVDIIKAQYTRISGVTSKDYNFWVAVGLDQFAHTVFAIPMIVSAVYIA